MDNVSQMFEAEIRVYYGKKIILSDKDYSYLLRFKVDEDGYYTELECAITKGTQKTFSSTKPTLVTLKSYQEIEDIDYFIRIKDRFILYDGDEKIGRGKITDSIFQK